MSDLLREYIHDLMVDEGAFGAWGKSLAKNMKQVFSPDEEPKPAQAKKPTPSPSAQKAEKILNPYMDQSEHESKMDRDLIGIKLIALANIQDSTLKRKIMQRMAAADQADIDELKAAMSTSGPALRQALVQFLQAA